MKELGLHISIHDYFNFFISIFFQIVNIFLSTDNMYFLLITLLLPMIKAIVIVKIHQSTIYKPENPYAFLRNISLLKDASIQSCHSECFHESNCRTAVYFNDKKVVHYLLNGVNQMVLFKHLETIEQVLFAIVQVKVRFFFSSKLNMINFY